MDKKIRISASNNLGHLWLDGKLYKVRKYQPVPKDDALKGVFNMEFVEVDPQEYDARIEAVAKRIASYPQVDLLDTIRDALYDLPLCYLQRLEEKLNKEEIKANVEGRKPKVETRRGERGTCCELRIGGKYALNLRE